MLLCRRIHHLFRQTKAFVFLPKRAINQLLCRVTRQLSVPHISLDTVYSSTSAVQFYTTVQSLMIFMWLFSRKACLISDRNLLMESLITNLHANILNVKHFSGAQTEQELWHVNLINGFKQISGACISLVFTVLRIHKTWISEYEEWPWYGFISKEDNEKSLVSEYLNS